MNKKDYNKPKIISMNILGDDVCDGGSIPVTSNPEDVEDPRGKNSKSDFRIDDQPWGEF